MTAEIASVVVVHYDIVVAATAEVAVVDPVVDPVAAGEDHDIPAAEEAAADFGAE